MRARLAIAVAALPAVLLAPVEATSDSGAPARAAGSSSLVGSAEVRVNGEGGKASARVVFSATDRPQALRLEVVRAGGVSAVVFADESRLRVLVPGRPGLLHENEPTRDGFEETLGLPFCLDELLFALRAGDASAPACAGESASVPVRRDDGRVLGLRRPEDRRGRPGLLRFSRFRAGSDGVQRPQRAVLESPEAVAAIRFGVLRPHDRPPLDLDQGAVQEARRVDAAGLRRALGLEGSPS